MSEGNPRPNRGGEYDFSSYNKGSQDNHGSSTRRTNTSSGERTQSSSSRYSGTSSYPESHERHGYSQNRSHQDRRSEDYSHHTHSGRNSTGSHQLPFHKSYDTTPHNSETINRGMYRHQPQNRGDVNLKDEFENNGSDRKKVNADKGLEGSSQSGHHYSNSQLHRKSGYNSADQDNKSNEGNQLNFPPGHPNHNPHLPPPNPFSQHPPSHTSTNSHLSKSRENLHKQSKGSRDNREINDSYDNNRCHERLPDSTAILPNIKASHGDHSLHKTKKHSLQNELKSGSSGKDHEQNKLQLPAKSQTALAPAENNKSLTSSPKSSDSHSHSDTKHRNRFGSKATNKEIAGRDEDKKFKENSPRKHDKDTDALPSSKNDVISKNEDKPETLIPSKRLLSESKDVLSDGSDSDALVIDISDTSAAEDKKFDRNNDDDNDTWTSDKSIKSNKNSIDSLAEEPTQLSKSPSSGKNEMKLAQNSPKHKSLEMKHTLTSSNTSEEIKSTENTSSKSKIEKGSTPAKYKKKNVSHTASKPEKFDPVENALEAMFGLEDIQGGKSKFSDNRKRKLVNDSKKKEKETNKQKKGPSSGVKKGEGGVVAKPLTMTKVSTPEKPSSGSQKKPSKRKNINDIPGDAKAIPRKPGRPRSQSTASDVAKGKQRNATLLEKKNSIISDWQSHNGRNMHDDTLDKGRGPCIRVEGNLDNPKWVGIINSAIDNQNEDQDAPGNKRKKGTIVSSGKSGPLASGVNDLEHRVRVLTGFGHRGHHTSTLSSSKRNKDLQGRFYDRYDPRKPDPTWLCVFCHQGSHHSGLGDLFGPYSVSSSAVDIPARNTTPMGSPIYTHPTSPSSSKSKQELAVKFILGEGGSTKRKRHRKSSTEGGSQLRDLQNAISGSTSETDKVEIWFHEDCISWMADIRLVGHVILGLEDAITSSRKSLCFKCNLPGSTVGCIALGCRELAHFHCAKDARWAIDDNYFQARCSKHRPS